ncbi:MAG: dolichyl-phosphate-mannose--protein mannosyltransferase [Microcoleaceae cyanobacterium]
MSQRQSVTCQFAIVALFVVGLVLRFWGLGRFNTLVFDEVYYAQFANNYWTRTPFFNAHPPLCQYLIAIGIWIASHLPIEQSTVNDLTGSTLAPWSYRWMNALIGAGIPPIVGGIAYQLSRQWNYALLTTLFMEVEGLFLVESRYALSNVYIVFFGLVAQLCFLIALSVQKHQRWKYLALAGICFGATVAVKWNGLGFLLGTDLLLACGWIIKLFNAAWLKAYGPINSQQGTTRDFDKIPKPNPWQSPLQRLTDLTATECLLTLAIVPLVTYFLLWIPHLQLNPEPGLWRIQTVMWRFHQDLGSGADIHPYCAPWYTWPLMLRPIVYFYETLTPATPAEITQILPTPLPTQLPQTYDVHGMGNPVLWWLSVVALGFLLLRLLVLAFVISWQYISNPCSTNPDSTYSWKNQSVKVTQNQNHSIRLSPLNQFWLILYILVNWAANFLPWIQITRCVFLYHYMGALVFAIMGCSWWIGQLIQNRRLPLKLVGVSVIILCMTAFLFWLPVYLGLPISPDAWKVKMWFSSWI